MDEQVRGGEAVVCHHCATLDDMQRWWTEQGGEDERLARIGALRERHQLGSCLASGGLWVAGWSW
jgi:hypothetical protein